MQNRAKKSQHSGCLQSRVNTLTYQKKWPAAAFVVACGARVIVLCDIDSLMWIMCVILEESLAEMPQYISVTRGMCGVISRADFLVTGGGWGSANKNLFFTIQGVILPYRHTHTCRDVHLHVDMHTDTHSAAIHTASFLSILLFLSFVLLSFSLTI